MTDRQEDCAKETPKQTYTYTERERERIGTNSQIHHVHLMDSDAQIAVCNADCDLLWRFFYQLAFPMLGTQLHEYGLWTRYQ